MYSYIKDCKDYGVQLDTEKYQLGWHQGIVQYCTPANGFEVGQAGEDYDDICPSHLAGAFLDQYIAGLDSKLSLIEDDIDSNTAAAEDTINQLEETTDKETRKSLRSTVSSYRTKYHDLKKEYRRINNLYNKAQRMRMQFK